MTGLRNQVRVVASLVLREARVRHGRSRIGYLWAIIEPAGLVIFLTVIFSEFRSSIGPASDFALFFALGVLPFQLFRSTSQYMSHAILANRPLFNYLPVRPIDAVISRWILETFTIVLVMVLVLAFQITVLDAPMPDDLRGLALMIAMTAFFAFGAGTCLATCRIVADWLANAYVIIMGPAFFLSCVFYSLQSVPVQIRELLVWNPLVHVVEGFRHAYIGSYRAPDVDLTYLFMWAFVLTFAGLFTQVFTARIHQT
jgi:capsular polysaccharide transport system permease protein